MKYTKDVSIQVIGVFVSNAGQFTSGYGIGFLGPFGTDLQEQFNLSSSAVTWVASSITLAGIPGCLVAGKMADTMGRRNCLFLCYILSSIGWLLVTLSNHLLVFILGRVIHGFGEGMVIVITPMYLGEISPARYKAVLVASVTVAGWGGNAVIYALGLFLSWRLCAALCVLISVLGLLCLLLVPESPLWLAGNGRDEEAERAFKKFKGDEEEMNLHIDNKMLSLGEMLKKLSFRRDACVFIPPLIIVFYPLNGGFSMAFFAVDLISSMGISQPEVISVFVVFLRMFGTVFSLFFLQKFGRRDSLILSSSIVTACSFIICFLLFTNLVTKQVEDLLLILLLLLSMFCYGLGMGPVPWVLCSEWPSMDLKVRLYLHFMSQVLIVIRLLQALVNTAATLCYFTSVFLSAPLASFILSVAGMPSTYSMFALVNCIVLGIVLVLVPETGGSSYTQFRKERKKGMEEGQVEEFDEILEI